MFKCINTKKLIIDVRDEKEHLKSDSKIIKNTINIPLKQLERKIRCLKIDKCIPIIVFCDSGKRSKVATIILRDLGYTNVFDIGGYKNLERLGILK
ncbi:MAG: rhodanese-like domain-containing protein [Clostridiales bacterium]|nr:rhodanese-like domain-containing protein [Clostridiales bacterium]